MKGDTMQKGRIYIARGSWCLQWRETLIDATGNSERVRRFKVLAPVAPEHKRNLKRIPKEIDSLAQQTLAPINNGTAPTVLRTIGDLITEYLKQRQLKPSTVIGYRRIFERYLEKRIGERTIADFRIVDAHRLWQDVYSANKHLSRQTMNHVRFFLAGAFRYAIENGFYFGSNPCSASLPEGLRGRQQQGAYTVEEIASLLSILVSPMARAIVALAFGSGLRKGELAGLKWEDYKQDDSGAVIQIRRSVWQGITLLPKTEASSDVVHVSPEIVAFVEAYREFAGGVNEGWMFPGVDDKSINLDSFARWQLKPLMNRCAICKKHKAIHKNEEHGFERDASLPAWKGWHSFRRGNATYLAKKMSGDGVKAASLMLRHSDPAVTQDHYVLTTRQERRAQEARKAIEIEQTRQQAAATLGAGLKAAIQ